MSRSDPQERDAELKRRASQLGGSGYTDPPVAGELGCGWGVAGAVLIVVFMILLALTDAAQQRLVSEGVRADAVVHSFSPQIRVRQANVVVTYVAGGEHYRKRIFLDESVSFYEGERIGVVYDPQKPTKVTIPGENTTGPILTILMILCLTIGFAMVVTSGWHFVKRRLRRFRTARLGR